MKKLLFFVLLAVSASAHAVTLPADEEEAKKDIVLKKGDNSSWTMHFGLGVNVVTGAPDGYKFNAFRSWDIQLTIAQYEYKPKGAAQTYAAGIGLNWSNYGLKDNGTQFTKVGDVVTAGEYYPVDSEDQSSHVQTFAINVPLLFTQNFGKHFSVTLGPVVNFNVGGWVEHSYTLGDTHVESSTKKIGQRPVTVDVLGVFDIYGVGAFCKYSPMSVFKKDRGPEFKSLTFGLYL